MPMCNCKYSPVGKDKDQLIDDLLTAAKEGELKTLEILIKGKHVDLNAVTQKSMFQQGTLSSVLSGRGHISRMVIQKNANTETGGGDSQWVRDFSSYLVNGK